MQIAKRKYNTGHNKRALYNKKVGSFSLCHAEVHEMIVLYAFETKEISILIRLVGEGVQGFVFKASF